MTSIMKNVIDWLGLCSDFMVSTFYSLFNNFVFVYS